MLYPNCREACYLPVAIGLTTMAISMSLLVLFWSYIALVVEEKL